MMIKTERVLFFCLLSFGFFSLPALAETYYISPSGDGTNGLTPETAWRTISQLNQHSHRPGDVYRFEGGQTFQGSLEIWTGDPNNPITVNSYGDGRATIESRMERGLWSCSAGGLILSNLNFIGAGSDVNNLIGIALCNSGSQTGPASNFRISEVNVSGYGLAGIEVRADEYGISNVEISRCEVHHNTNGILIAGDGDPIRKDLHKVHITDVKVYHNDTSRLTPMAGYGIVLNNVDGGMVERSLIYENGLIAPGPGHGGLISTHSSNLLIQGIEAWGARDPYHGDGHSFAFLGVTDSVIQHNYTHDNMTAYVLTEQDGVPSARITLRYNIVQNDIIGIVCWGSVVDTVAHNNTLFVEWPTTGPFRAGIVFVDFTGSNIQLWNNILQTRGGAPMIMVEPNSMPYADGFRCLGNTYDPLDGEGIYVIYGDEREYYENLSDWRAGRGQELLGSLPVGYEGDPHLTDPGGGGTIGDPDSLPWKLNAYRLQIDSPVRTLGLDLQALFGMDPGSVDFYRSILPGIGSMFSIGAHQLSVTAPGSGSSPPPEKP